VRNVLIAIGNSSNPALAAEAEPLLSDPSPLVRSTAIWALGRLAPQRLAVAAQGRGRDVPEVEGEWDAALAVRTRGQP
jgi:epoxyqueuosine reductase